jgi:hypothetical protein
MAAADGAFAGIFRQPEKSFFCFNFQQVDRLLNKALKGLVHYDSRRFDFFPTTHNPTPKRIYTT